MEEGQTSTAWGPISRVRCALWHHKIDSMPGDSREPMCVWGVTAPASGPMAGAQKHARLKRSPQTTHATSITHILHITPPPHTPPAT